MPNRGKNSLKTPKKNVTIKNLHKCLIYRKLMACQVGGMRSSASVALDRSAFDRKRCARSQCVRSQALRPIAVRSIASVAIDLT